MWPWTSDVKLADFFPHTHMWHAWWEPAVWEGKSPLKFLERQSFLRAALTLHKLLHLLSGHLLHKPNSTNEPQNQPKQPEQTASPDLQAVGNNFLCSMQQILCCKFWGVKVLNCFNAPSDSVEYCVAQQLRGRSGTLRQAKSWQGLKVNSWGLEINEPDKRSLSN